MFAGGFEFIDKLGVVSAAGQSLVFRQTLCGYRYGLVNFDLTTNPGETGSMCRRLLQTELP